MLAVASVLPTILCRFFILSRVLFYISHQQLAVSYQQNASNPTTEGASKNVYEQ